MCVCVCVRVCVCVCARVCVCVHACCFAAQLDPPHSDLLYMKGGSVCFLNEHTWLLSSGQQGRYMHMLSDLVEKVNTKKINPSIHHTVELANVPQAFKQLSDCVIGKVVMRMAD